jgi:hypothetical protein
MSRSDAATGRYETIFLAEPIYFAICSSPMIVRGTVIGLWPILVANTLVAAPLERSVSPSRQFVIYGADTRSRGGVSDLAENTKANLLAIIRSPDGWKTPIIINLQRPQANLPEIPPVSLRFSQTGFGLKLQLDLVIGAKVDLSMAERELLRAIVLEMIYRNEPELAPGTPYIEPPDWLLDGILALAPDRDRAPVIEALAVSNRIMPLREFLEQSPRLLDSPARQLFQAYSFALVQLLIDQTDGRRRLGRYIGNLSRGSDNSLVDLQAQFPELAADDSGEQIWKSNIIRLSRPNQLLSFAATDGELDQCFQSFGGANSTSQLREFFRRKPSRSEIASLGHLSQNLLLLAARAHPLLRPTIQEYAQIAYLLASGKTKRLASKLANADALRVKIAARMSEIDDYMNWCEATKPETASGVFTNYLSAAEQQGEMQLRRHDALSVYLDALEAEVEN